MPSNIEIKARVSDAARMRRMVEGTGASGPQLLVQEDIFFPCRQGRMKLRILSADDGELICYDRPDQPGAKCSEYAITHTSAPLELREVLDRALGVLAVVKKRRLLYLLKQTRIHLDEVENLGSFIELEVVLLPGQAAEEGGRIVHDLMQRLEIAESDLISCAYADLLSQRQNKDNHGAR